MPNIADSNADGTQYRSRPGSRYGLTTTTLVPDFTAWSRYFMNTGWLFAGFVPHRTTRSDSITSRSEQVDAATPIVDFRPDGRRASGRPAAAESMLAMPRARAALPAA